MGEQLKLTFRGYRVFLVTLTGKKLWIARRPNGEPVHVAGQTLWRTRKQAVDAIQYDLKG